MIKKEKVIDFDSLSHSLKAMIILLGKVKNSLQDKLLLSVPLICNDDNALVTEEIDIPLHDVQLLRSYNTCKYN